MSVPFRGTLAEMLELFTRCAARNPADADKCAALIGSTLARVARSPAPLVELTSDLRPSPIGWYVRPHPDPLRKHNPEEDVYACERCIPLFRGPAYHAGGWYPILRGHAPPSLRCAKCGRGSAPEPRAALSGKGVDSG